MENRLTTFGHNFQIKSISSLMTNSNFLAQIYDILDESHYDNESLKWVIKQCKSYYNEYKKKHNINKIDEKDKLMIFKNIITEKQILLVILSLLLL